MPWYAVQDDSFDWSTEGSKALIVEAKDALTAAEDALAIWIKRGEDFDTLTVKVAKLEFVMREDFVRDGDKSTVAWIQGEGE